MNYINKFGESLNRQQNQLNKQKTNTKLHIDILKTLDVSVNNQCFDVRKKRICNLLPPIDPKDAVTKAYLNNKIDDLMETHTNDIDMMKQEINTSLAVNLQTIYKDIENIKTKHKTDIESLSQLYNEIKNINATHLSDMKQLNNIIRGMQEKVYKDIDSVTKSVQNHIINQAKTIEQITKKYILSHNREYKDKVEERFNKLEEYTIKLSAVDERLNNIEDYLYNNIVGRFEKKQKK